MAKTEKPKNRQPAAAKVSKRPKMPRPPKSPGRPRGGAGQNKQREFSPDWAVVGSAVAATRRAAGHSQASGAAAAGISQSYLSSLEAGERKPTIDSLRKIALGWGVSVRDLIPAGW